MSSLIVNFPDCAELGSRDADSRDEQQDTITVFTDGCPAPPASPPPLIPGYGWLLGVVVLVAAIIGTVVVRYKAHEQRPAHLAAANEARKLELEAKNKARAQELNAQVQMAQARKVCPTCLDSYEPEVQ